MLDAWHDFFRVRSTGRRLLLFSGTSAARLLAVLIGLFGAAGGFSFLEMAPAAQVALTILLIAITLWVSEAVPLFVTGLLILLLSLVWLAPVMRQEGHTINDSVFLKPFFSDVIVLFLGGFVLAAGLHQCRIAEFLARRILMWASGSVPRLIAGIMGVTALLGMWLSNTATAAMMLALCWPIINTLPAGDRYRKALVLAVPLAANIGGMSTPIASPPNAIAMQYLRQSQGELSFGMWMLVGVPGMLVMLGVAWCVLMLFFRGQVTTVSQTPQTHPLEFNRATRWVIVVAVLAALGWLTGTWHGYSAGTVALLPVVVFFGLGILPTDTLRTLSWDVLLMMGGGLCLGTITAESGLASWLVAQLPIGQNNLLLLTIIFATLAVSVGSIMSNTATANVLMPIILGVNPELQMPLLVVTALCCSLAMPLPISTPPNAMAFSSGELTTGDMLRAGGTITIVGLLLTITAGYLWADWIGLF